MVVVLVSIVLLIVVLNSWSGSGSERGSGSVNCGGSEAGVAVSVLVVAVTVLMVIQMRIWKARRQEEKRKGVFADEMLADADEMLRRGKERCAREHGWNVGARLRTQSSTKISNLNHNLNKNLKMYTIC